MVIPISTTVIPRLVRGIHAHLARVVFMGGRDEPGDESSVVRVEVTGKDGSRRR